MDFVHPTSATFCRHCGQVKSPAAVAWAQRFFVDVPTYAIPVGHFRCLIEGAQQAHEGAMQLLGEVPEMLGLGFWRDTLDIPAAAIEPAGGTAPWSYPSAANLAEGLPTAS